MPVTDLTPTLPWGGSPNGQTQLPPGYGGGTSWLNYLASMFNPVSSAQADVLHPNLTQPMHNFSNPPPANGPGPGNVGPVQLDNGHGDGPPGPVNPDPTGSSVTMAPKQPPGLDPTTMAAARAAFAAPATFAGSQPNQGGGFAGAGAGAGGPSWFPGGSNTPMPWNSPVSTPRGIDQATADAGRAALAAPGATAAPRATPQGGGPNNRFVQLDQGQNIDPTNRRGGPQMTALNLAGLFGGGQGEAPGAGQPQGTPAQTPRPTVPGPMAQGGMSRAPWGIGPMQKGMVFPNQMGPMTQDQLAAASLRQRYA
jgi:hypothetical protein